MSTSRVRVCSVWSRREAFATPAAELITQLSPVTTRPDGLSTRLGAGCKQNEKLAVVFNNEIQSCLIQINIHEYYFFYIGTLCDLPTTSFITSTICSELKQIYNLHTTREGYHPNHKFSLPSATRDVKLNWLKNADIQRKRL